MSSELERLLRDARALPLPGPADDATLHARRRAVTPPRRRRATHRRSRRRDARGSDGDRSHGRLPHRADGHGCSRAGGARVRPRARMVRASVTSASSPGSADGRGGRQCPLRCRRRRARTRRAFGLAVLHPPAAAAARNRDRLDDGSGHGAARRSDSHEHDVSRGRASSPAPRRRDLSAMGGPGAARPAARAVPASRTDSTPQRRRGGVLRNVAAVEVTTRRGTAPAGRSRHSTRRRARHEARRGGTAKCGGGYGDRPHVRVQHDDPGRSLRAEDSCALRRQKGFGVGEAAVRRRGDRRLGRAPDGPAERAAQLPRVDHGRVPHRVDHRRQRV